jgi:hypothetical protein
MVRAFVLGLKKALQLEGPNSLYKAHTKVSGTIECLNRRLRG